MAGLTLGIDPSSKTLAICWWYEDAWMGLRKWDFTDTATPETLRWAQGAVRRFYGNIHLGAGDVVILEQPVMGVNIQSTIKQAKMNGVVEAETIKTGATLHVISNSAWKKQVALSGSASKADIAAAARALEPALVDETDQDLLDAYCISLYVPDPA